MRKALTVKNEEERQTAHAESLSLQQSITVEEESARLDHKTHKEILKIKFDRKKKDFQQNTRRRVRKPLKHSRIWTRELTN